jgi:hypothetical protein
VKPAIHLNYSTVIPFNWALSRVTRSHSCDFRHEESRSDTSYAERPFVCPELVISRLVLADGMAEGRVLVFGAGGRPGPALVGFGARACGGSFLWRFRTRGGPCQRFRCGAAPSRITPQTFSGCTSHLCLEGRQRAIISCTSRSRSLSTGPDAASSPVLRARNLLASFWIIPMCCSTRRMAVPRT